MTPRLLFLFLALVPFHAMASERIDIGVLTEWNTRQIELRVVTGEYTLNAANMKLATLIKGSKVSLIRRDSKVQVILDGKSLGDFSKVAFNSSHWEGVFHLTMQSNPRQERVYDDDLLVSPASGSLLLVNRVNLEKYVAGVVEAESGRNKHLEFYKAQAIIARTYALSNKRRFLHKGFNLNDRVDCQVYHGKSRFDPNILEATRLTENIVLVDADLQLITAAYHSNSGGYTVNSDQVWQGILPYLEAREDTFSIGGDHYNWSRLVSKKEWLGYLSRKFNFPTNDRLLVLMATNYYQEKRNVYFIDPDFNIPLKVLRKDWQLNSTYFHIEEQGDSIVFSGRGFGHGLGLSQEGAMRMADLGFSYEQILFFYYKNVHIVDYRQVPLLRED